MKEKVKKYYKYLDIMRIFLCLSILFYHLNILKGGYLAVCSFFVISGYLSCAKLFKEKNISLKDYYKKRLFRLYLPILVVVLVTLVILALCTDITIINLKQEITSILLGYNNFWQLQVNSDYFAQHINSPYMHLWYTSILLQFDLIFPILFIGLKKLGEKTKKFVPLIVLGIFSISSFWLFSLLVLKNQLMAAYYNTFARLFSLLFGVMIGFIHNYYKPMIRKEDKKNNCLILGIYTFFLCMLFIFISSSSKLFLLSMILVTLISGRMLEYITLTKEKWDKRNKLISGIANLCYEIYLIQYPVIFFFQDINLNIYLKYLVIILVILGLAFILNRAFRKNDKYKLLDYSLKFVIVGLTIYGIYSYVTLKDHAKEMKILEEQLEINEKMLKEKQQEYQAAFKEQEEEFKNELEKIGNDEEELKKYISNLNIVGIGDSVMLGAVNELYNTFPNGYFDAKVSRSILVLSDMLKELKEKNMLGNTIIINLGANGNCSDERKKEIMDIVGDRQVFWLTVTNDRNVHFNAKIKKFAKDYDNLHIIDWESITKGHDEYFYVDGIHLNGKGRKKYAEVIYQTLYDEYVKKINALKEETLRKYEEELKKRINIYGNDLAINLYNNLNYLKNTSFITDKNFDFNTLKNKLISDKENKTLAYNIVFSFDGTMSFSKEEYVELFDLCKENNIYVITLNEENNKNIKELSGYNITLIDFSREIELNDNYLMIDMVHLSKDGNEALSNLIKEKLKDIQ